MSKPDPQFSPMQIARDAGASGSAWHRLGDGPWTGTVTAQDGTQFEVEQLARSWNVTDETGISTRAAELAAALAQSGLA